MEKKKHNWILILDVKMPLLRSWGAYYLDDIQCDDLIKFNY